MSQYGIRNEAEVAGPSGAGDYVQPVFESDANYVVNTESEMKDALSQASANEVVWVEPSATIDADPDIDVPPDVTLASLRDATHDGALLYSNRSYSGDSDNFINMSNGSRLVGLRIRGPYGDYEDPHAGQGVNGSTSNITVENCEVYNWGYAGVDTDATPSYIHHCHIHHVRSAGNGYGVTVQGDSDWVYIYLNQFDYCRHAVAGHGNAHGRIRDNLFTDTQTPHFTIDKHDPGGDYRVHHNELRISDRTNVQFQDGPPDNALIEWNWSYNDNPPGDCSTGEHWVCVDGGDLSNLTIQDNWLGSSEPPGTGVANANVAALSTNATSAGAGIRDPGTVIADPATASATAPGVSAQTTDLNHFEIIPADGHNINPDNGFAYTYTTTSEPQRGSSAESHDTITDNGDGTWTVDGLGGANTGDDWFLAADGLLEWSAEDASTGDPLANSNFDFYWNGELRTMDSLLIEEGVDALVIRHEPAVGTTASYDYIAVSISEKYDKQWTAQVTIPRETANTMDPKEGVDELYIVDDQGVDEFGGIVRDVKRSGGTTATLILDSFERYAREAEPLPTRTTFDGVADSTIISDAISRVPQLSEGDIDTIKTGLSFSFSNVSPAREMRIVRNVTKGKLVYNPDKTVDYKQSIGEDKR